MFPSPMCPVCHQCAKFVTIVPNLSPMFPERVANVPWSLSEVGTVGYLSTEVAIHHFCLCVCFFLCFILSFFCLCVRFSNNDDDNVHVYVH